MLLLGHLLLRKNVLSLPLSMWESTKTHFLDSLFRSVYLEFAHFTSVLLILSVFPFVLFLKMSKIIYKESRLQYWIQMGSQQIAKQAKQ